MKPPPSSNPDFHFAIRVIEFWIGCFGTEAAAAPLNQKDAVSSGSDIGVMGAIGRNDLEGGYQKRCGGRGGRWCGR